MALMRAFAPCMSIALVPSHRATQARVSGSSSSAAAGRPSACSRSRTSPARPESRMVLHASNSAPPSTSMRVAATSWPSAAQARPACSTAATQSGCTGTPVQLAVTTPMRSRPGSRPSCARNGSAGGAVNQGAPSSGPAVASRMAAQSRTLRVTACSWLSPIMASPRCGPTALRPRVGFSPTSPQQAAGMRMEPRLSVACAAGSIPPATAAPAPPLEPPGECAADHGLRVAPCSAGSVLALMPNSGELVRPTITNPAARSRVTVVLSKSNTLPANRRLAWLSGRPATGACRSLMKYGTPVNGPSGSPARMAARALSNACTTTAFRRGLSASTCAMQASSTSSALTWRLRTRAARPIASWLR